MANKEKNFVSAIVYVHNAESRIESFLSTVLEVLETNFEHSEIICVNDKSDDKSVEKIKAVSKKAKASTITLLNLSHYHGLETAMNAGADLAIGDFVFEFDRAVLDFEAQEIMNVYKRCLQGYDIVSASPDKKQRLSSKLFYMTFNKFARLKYEMSTESFRILSRRVLNRISSMNKTVPYRKAIYANCGLKTDHLRYRVCETRQQNRTAERQEKRYRTTLALDSLILFTDFGYQFSLGMMFLMIAIVVFMAVYSLVVYLVGNPVEGWTTTILFLSFCFFGLFGILAVIVKYLQIIVNLIFKKNQYNFESIEKLTK